MATVLFVEASGAEHRIDVPTGENLMRAALNEGLDGMVGARRQLRWPVERQL